MTKHVGIAAIVIGGLLVGCGSEEPAPPPAKAPAPAASDNPKRPLKPVKMRDLIGKVVPGVARARKRANQTAAIATLRNLISAQAQMQAAALIDGNDNGVGEYGGFAEMSGKVPGRMASTLRPPVLSGSFQLLNAHGEVSRSGYHFRLVLPDNAGAGVAEPAKGFGPQSGVDATLCEITWCCYAWPQDANAAGTRVFFTNQVGDIYETSDPRYVGAGKGPRADAAFQTANAITGDVRDGAQGRDGNTWSQVN